MTVILLLWEQMWMSCDRPPASQSYRSVSVWHTFWGVPSRLWILLLADLSCSRFVRCISWTHGSIRIWWKTHFVCLLSLTVRVRKQRDIQDVLNCLQFGHLQGDRQGCNQTMSWSCVFPDTVIVNRVCCCCFTVLLYIFSAAHDSQSAASACYMVPKHISGRWRCSIEVSSVMTDETVPAAFRSCHTSSGSFCRMWRKTLICFSNSTCWILFFFIAPQHAAWYDAVPVTGVSYSLFVAFTPRDHLGWGRGCLPLDLLLSGSHLLTTHWICCCRAVSC